MLNLSSDADNFTDYATVQQTGKLFVAIYYGRLNASTKSWSMEELLTERSQYHALDTLDGRPAVGRANVVRAIDRFRDNYGSTESGKRRIVFPLSIDAQIDEDDERSDDYSAKNGRINRYTVFVQAEWTEEFRSGAPSAVTSFVQTFRVRHLCSDGGRFEIISTVVKITGQSQKQSHCSSKDSIHSGSEKNYNETPQVKCENVIHSNCKDQCKDSNTHFESVNNGYETPQSKHQTPHMHLIDTTPSHSNKQLNAEAIEFNLTDNDESPPSFTSTVPVVNETYKQKIQMNDGYRMNAVSSELWPTQEYLDYEKKVNAFLKGHTEPKKPTSSMKSSYSPKKYHRRSGKQQKSHEYTANVEANDYQTNTVYVDGLVGSTTANQLQSALTPYGPVKSVRMFSSDESGFYLPNKPIQHAAKIRFENNESVEKIMSDSRSPGFNFKGKKLGFRKSNPSRL